jgi:polynucleotide 5'-kinase involved in rRNA processing
MAETSELDRMIKALNRSIVENAKVASSKVDERKTKLEEYYRAQINDLA